MQNFFIWLEAVLHSSKRWWLWKQPVVGWHWWLWKEPVVMCGNWNVGQATSQQVFKVTVHLLHGYTLPVFFTTDQLHRPPRCAEIQPMSQQDASVTCPYRGLVLDTLASCPRCGNHTGWGQDCSLATRQDWPMKCLYTVQKLKCVTSTMCWRIVSLEDKHVSSNAADCW